MKREVFLKIVMCIAAMLVGLSISASPSGPLDVSIHTLENGMQVWLNEDHSTPTVVGMVAVKAGAKDCPDTGIAHYFEHIMFKGTERIGTVDYEKEKPFLDSIEYEYSRLRSTLEDEERRQIHKRINELSVEAARYAVPNEFSTLITEFGGSGLNAGTSWDYTVYYNTFSSNNIVPWLELNSERLIDPVFRMFQSELETVYEEKNMYSDGLGAGAMEYALESLFEPHPYSRPIIGTTENLKNPDPDAMRDFYNKYYVAGNMALLLSGDFDTQTVLPEIERYFSRIPSGVVSPEPLPEPAPFSGRDLVKLKLPIPLIKVGASVWRTPEESHPDKIVLDVAALLLNNENGTGLLDKMKKERDVLAAGIGAIGLNDTGVMAMFYVPKALISGLRKAEARSVSAVAEIKNGEFTDEELAEAKREWLKDFDLSLESPDNRAMLMMSLYTSGKNWNDYIAMRDRVEQLKREDVTRVMNHYIGDNRMVFEKKTGSYPKDRIEKPGYGAVEPQREVTQSEYAKRLIAEHRQEVSPRFIDTDADIDIKETGNNRIIGVANPYNNIYELEMRYWVGTQARPLAGYLSGYLNYCDSDSLTNLEFQSMLRKLGATASFGVRDGSFSIYLTGFEDTFEEAYGILETFIQGLKPTGKGKESAVSGQKMYEKGRTKSNDEVSYATAEKLLYGMNASQLRELSAKELKKVDDGAFLELLREILGYRQGVYYCGGLAADEVEAVVGVGPQTKPVAEKAYFPLREFAGNEVYLADMKGSRQSIVDMYVRTGELTSERDRHLARLFNMYMGGSMNSLLFQEIREYRPFAYTASSWMSVPDPDEKERTGLFNCYMTTQTDKTAEAIALLDSLVRNVEFTQERLDRAVRQLGNNINNSFPGFREIAAHTDTFLMDGYSEDPNKALYETLQGVTLADLQDFYDRHIRGRAALTVITGDGKALGKETVSRLGAVYVDKKTLFKK